MDRLDNRDQRHGLSKQAKDAVVRMVEEHNPRSLAQIIASNPDVADRLRALTNTILSEERRGISWNDEADHDDPEPMYRLASAAIRADLSPDQSRSLIELCERMEMALPVRPERFTTHAPSMAPYLPSFSSTSRVPSILRKIGSMSRHGLFQILFRAGVITAAAAGGYQQLHRDHDYRESAMARQERMRLDALQSISSFKEKMEFVTHQFDVAYNALERRGESDERKRQFRSAWNLLSKVYNDLPVARFEVDPQTARNVARIYIREYQRHHSEPMSNLHRAVRNDIHTLLLQFGGDSNLPEHERILHGLAEKFNERVLARSRGMDAFFVLSQALQECAKQYPDAFADDRSQIILGELLVRCDHASTQRRDFTADLKALRIDIDRLFVSPR